MLREEGIWLVRRKWEELGSQGLVRIHDPKIAVSLAVAVALAVLGLIICYPRFGSKSFDSTAFGGLPADAVPWTPPEHLRPLIFPAQTTHARIFPKRHAFKYSYLLYGIPIVPAGTRPCGIRVGSFRDQRRGSWWLHARPGDYLFRGQAELGFYNKLAVFLQSQGVPNDEWAYAYLVTAPRFFGYSFNPVSFWYIYDESHRLKKMVLEVNNTFGERRAYLLDGSCPASPAHSSEDETSRLPAKSMFTNVWTKDFHVSPFNSRKGAYALKAFNPFQDPDGGVPKVDNTITLKSSKDHAKIVARVYSTDMPLEPSNLSILQAARFVVSWWWVGLFTFPRILKEALKLFSVHKLHVWFKPEVISPSLGRLPTQAETQLQRVFESYLYYLVNAPDEFWNITYHTCIPERPQTMMATTYRHALVGRTPKQLEIRVLTPAFYSRFVHYRHTSEAFDRECIFTEEKNRTFWISNPEMLPQLLSKSSRASLENGVFPMHRRYMDEVRWRLMRELRGPPAAVAYPSPNMSPDYKVDDIRSLPYSDLDLFVRGPLEYRSAQYRRLLTQLFLAQRLAFGFANVISVLDLFTRIALCYAGSRAMISWAETRGTGALERSAKLTMRETDWSWTGQVGLCVCLCHAYGSMKGYW
ncbi:DUF1365-domain-containing protein [Polyplosphaeria fusca]|uniref:DUF1365-domain-containing protein n=1 Tax=Polyplosphaeria fusca TaxID=682080 RepID=A0A9P4R5Q3_9PLEO|nr:DUF1365-domain-containing protein [Polyplosphaeria fusca]